MHIKRTNFTYYPQHPLEESEVWFFLLLQNYIKNLVLANLALVNLKGADLELFQLKEAILSEKTTMMDGTKYDETRVKIIADI